MKTQREGVYGAILGQAIGDALGSQTEFTSKPNFVFDLGPTWGYGYPAYSDDTQMMMAIAETILTFHPSPDITEWMTKMGENFVLWRKGDHPNWGRNNRSPGGTCSSATANFSHEHNWQTSGITNGGKGNGGAMRASVIGAAYWKNPVLAFKLGCISSVITHNNLESNLASGGVAYLVALAINGVTLHIAVGKLIELMTDWKNSVPVVAQAIGTADQDPMFVVRKIAAAYAYANGKVGFHDFQHWLGNDGKGVEALAGAIFYNVRACRYSESIINAATWSGDSDTVPAIGGAIAGARWGIGFIPKGWRERVEQTEYLHTLAERIYNFSLEVK